MTSGANNKIFALIDSIPIVYEMIPGAIVTVFLVDESDSQRSHLASNSLDIQVDNRAECQVSNNKLKSRVFGTVQNVVVIEIGSTGRDEGKQGTSELDTRFISSSSLPLRVVDAEFESFRL
jgi:hypothetical protein